MPAGSQESVDGDAQGEMPKRDPITTPDFFEEELRGLRRRLGWTQADLGTFFGVTKLTAHRWEKRGSGETEPRKAVLRLVESALERSRAPEKQVGRVLLDVGVARTMTAAVHESPRIKEGAIDRPMDWKIVFNLRDRLGWTQTEFARFLGVTHSVPAVWESGEGTFGDSIRAALLALDLSSDPHRADYPEPHPSWDELKTEGFGTFCKLNCELRIDP